MEPTEKRIKLNEEVVRPVTLEGLTANGHLADMAFLIVSEDITIPAHKLIVGHQSLILNRFVYGTEEWPATNPICVNNISSAAFTELLRFVYAKLVNLTEENALSIWLTANYYELIELVERCDHFLINHLSLSNVLECFKSSYLINKNGELFKNSLIFIQISFEDILINHDANKLFDQNNDILHEILTLNKINLSGEVKLFNEIVKYATQKCQQNNIEETGPNKRIEIDHILKYVRFPTMSEVEFCALLKSEPGFFSSEEIGDIIQAIVKVNVHSLYEHNPRVLLIKFNLTSNVIFQCQVQIDLSHIHINKVVAIVLSKKYSFNVDLCQVKQLLVNYVKVPITIINNEKLYYLVLKQKIPDESTFYYNPKFEFQITFDSLIDVNKCISKNVKVIFEK